MLSTKSTKSLVLGKDMQTSPHSLNEPFPFFFVNKHSKIQKNIYIFSEYLLEHSKMLRVINIEWGGRLRIINRVFTDIRIFLIFWSEFWTKSEHNSIFSRNFLSLFPRNMKILIIGKSKKKMGKLFFHTFQNIAHILGPKT